MRSFSFASKTRPSAEWYPSFSHCSHRVGWVLSLLSFHVLLTPITFLLLLVSQLQESEGGEHCWSLLLLFVSYSVSFCWWSFQFSKTSLTESLSYFLYVKITDGIISSQQGRNWLILSNSFTYAGHEVLVSSGHLKQYQLTKLISERIVII